MIISAEKAAEILGVSSWTVYEYCRQGVLPHKKLGRRVLLSKERLEDWVKGGEGDRQTVSGNSQAVQAQDGAGVASG